MGGFGAGGMPSMQEMQAQMQANPDMMSEIHSRCIPHFFFSQERNDELTNDAIDNVKSRVDAGDHTGLIIFVRTFRKFFLLPQSNPELREVMERNPEVGQLLSDPQVLRQV